MKIFKPGDKVIALTNPKNAFSQPRVKGKIYTVEAIYFCSGCGNQMVNLGFKTKNSKIFCGPCDNMQSSKGLCWTRSEHFSKVDDFEESLKEALENEDYEMASLLRDLNLKLQSNV